MLLVLGFDNTGKTTLSKKLSKSLDLTVDKSLGYDTREEQIQFMFQYMSGGSTFTINERFPFFEEMIYGPMFRGKSNFSLEEDLGERIKGFLPIIIYCRPPKEEILKFGDRKQMIGVEQNANDLINAWDELMFKLIRENWIILPYNWTEEYAFEKLLGEVEHNQKLREWRLEYNG